MKYIFDQLGRSNMFSTLGMCSVYWQPPMAKASIETTAFVCHQGQLEFVQLPFGLANACSVYKKNPNEVPTRQDKCNQSIVSSREC